MPISLTGMRSRKVVVFDISAHHPMQSFVKDVLTGQWYVAQIKETIGGLETLYVYRCAPDGAVLDKAILVGAGHGNSITIEHDGGAIYLWLRWTGIDKPVRWKYSGTVAGKTITSSHADVTQYTSLEPSNTTTAYYSIDEAAGRIASYRGQADGTHYLELRNLADYKAGTGSALHTIDITDYGVMQGFATVGDQVLVYRGAGYSSSSTSPPEIRLYSWSTGQHTGTLDVSGASGVDPGDASANEAEGLTVTPDGTVLHGIGTGAMGTMVSTVYRLTAEQETAGEVGRATLVLDLQEVTGDPMGDASVQVSYDRVVRYRSGGVVPRLPDAFIPLAERDTVSVVASDDPDLAEDSANFRIVVKVKRGYPDGTQSFYAMVATDGPATVALSQVLSNAAPVPAPYVNVDEFRQVAEDARDAAQSAATDAVGQVRDQVDQAAADAAVSAASATSAAQSAAEAVSLAEAPPDEMIAAVQSGPSTLTVSRSGVLSPATVDHAGVQAALDSAATFGLRVQTAGEYTTDQTLSIRADCDLSGLTITYTGAGIGIKVGPDTGSLQNRTVVLPHIKHGGKTVTGWAQVTGTIGIRLRNLYACTVTGRETGAFETGWQLLGDGSGCVYNKFEVGRLANNKVNLQLHTINAGWTNENVFVGGQCFHQSGEAAGGSGPGMTGPAIGTRHVLMTSGSSEWAGPNANKFYGLSLENVGTTEFAVDFDNAGRNHFDGCRWETWLGGTAGYSPRVRYGAVATENVITGGYDAHRIEVTLAAGGAMRGNNIISPLGERRRYANQPISGPGAVGGMFLDNASGNTSPVTQVMPANWETTGVTSASGWLWKWTGQTLEGKRTGDAWPRIKFDAHLGQFRLGSGTTDPASGMVGTASDLRAMSTFSPLTDAAYDLGVAANRWRNIRATGYLYLGGLILRATSGGDLQVSSDNGSTWKTVTLT